MRKREMSLLLLSRLSALLVLGVLGGLLAFLISRGGPVLGKELFFGDTSPLDALLGLRPVWNGIWPAVAGTLFLLLLTMIAIFFFQVDQQITFPRLLHKQCQSLTTFSWFLVEYVQRLGDYHLNIQFH